MPLSQAQLIAGDSTKGTVLPGRAQGVVAGAGIAISPTGVISSTQPWTVSGNILSPSVLSNAVGIGTATVKAGYALQVNGQSVYVNPFASVSLLETVAGNGWRWALANNGNLFLQSTTDGFTTVDNALVVSGELFSVSGHNISVDQVAGRKIEFGVGTFTPDGGVPTADYGLTYQPSAEQFTVGLSSFNSLLFYVGRTERMKIAAGDGSLVVNNLAGAGTRMVTADASGVLSTQAIPAGGGEWTQAGTNLYPADTATTNVGIGVDAATARLQVDNLFSSGIPAMKLLQPGAGWGTVSLFNAYRFLSTDTLAIDGNFKEFNVGAGGIAVGYNDTPVFNSEDAAYLKGNAGVGTNAPQDRLHVVGGGVTISTGGFAAGSGGIINFGISVLPASDPMAKVQGLLGNTVGTELQGGLGFFTRPVGAAGQTLQERINISAAGAVTISSLSGAGTRMVVADANGLLSSTTIPAGTVTGVTGTLPIVSSGGTAPDISINAATTTTAGSMSSADKTKLDGLSQVWTQAGTNLYPAATATTDVGIKTSTPWSALSVLGNGTAGDPTTARQFAVGIGDTYQVSLGYFQTGAALPFGGVLQALDNGSGTRLLLNPSGGDVGIGITSPAAPLDIKAGTFRGLFDNRAGGFTISAVDDGNTAYADLALQGREVSLVTGGVARIAVGETGLTYVTNLAGADTRMVVADTNGLLSTQAIPAGGGEWTQAGNNLYPAATATTDVGIGTATPASRLDVVGGRILVRAGDKTQTANYLTLQSTDAANQMGLSFTNNTNLSWSIQSIENGVAFRDLLLNTAGGNVGIGTAAAGEKLSVTGGNISVTDQVAGRKIEFGVGTFTPAGGVPTADYGLTYQPTADQFGVGLAAFGPLHFFTNQTERMRISSGGLVTLGNLAGTGTRMVVASATGDLSTQTIPAGGGDWTQAGTNLYPTTTATTDVGIGTNDPQSRLQVVGGDFTVSNGSYAAGDGGAVNFGLTVLPAAAPMAKIQGLLANTATTEIQGGLGFFTRPVGTAGQTLQERINISAGGVVTISNLAGTGTRMVVADANGLLSSMAVPAQPWTVNGVFISPANLGYQVGIGTATVKAGYYLQVQGGAVAVGGASNFAMLQTETTKGWRWSLSGDNLALEYSTDGFVANSSNSITTTPEGTVFINSLAGADTRMVVATNFGGLTTQAIPPTYTLPARLGTVAQEITDWDAATENGWYWGNAAANSPTATFYLGTVVVHNPLWLTQTVNLFTSTNSADTHTWQRSLNNGVWSAWYRLRISQEEQETLYPGTTGARASGTWGINITGGLTGTTPLAGYSASGEGVAFTTGFGGSQFTGQGGGAAMLSFHRPGAYAINFGLDTDNVLKVGGFSAGAVANTILHSGNYSTFANTMSITALPALP